MIISLPLSSPQKGTALQSRFESITKLEVSILPMVMYNRVALCLHAPPSFSFSLSLPLRLSLSLHPPPEKKKDSQGSVIGKQFAACRCLKAPPDNCTLCPPARPSFLWTCFRLHHDKGGAPSDCIKRGLQKRKGNCIPPLFIPFLPIACWRRLRCG